MLETLKEIITDVIGEKEMDNTTKISGLQMDSLDFVDFIAKLEDEFKITITDEEARLISCKTIGELMGFIDGK